GRSSTSTAAKKASRSHKRTVRGPTGLPPARIISNTCSPGQLHRQDETRATCSPQASGRPQKQLVEVEGSRTPRPRRDQPGFYERSPCQAFAVRPSQGPVRRRLTRWILATAARVIAAASLLALAPTAPRRRGSCGRGWLN